MLGVGRLFSPCVAQAGPLRVPGDPFSPVFPTLPGVFPPPGTDVDHALAPLSSRDDASIRSPSCSRSGRRSCGSTRVCPPASSDAVRGGLESFDCLPLEHPYERAQVTPVRLLQASKYLGFSNAVITDIG